MPNLPKLAIVGRPNVGKSALFNRIIEKKIAIVDEAEGITRDRLYAIGDFFGLEFEAIDTGGIDPRSKAPFNEQVKQQAEIAIEEADTIVMVVDALVGVTVLDQELAKILLKTKKPLCLAVNKIDDRMHQDLVHQFYTLGISNVVAVSASHGFQIAELLDAAFKGFTKPEEERPDDKTIHISIVGRPNVGKSSLINYLLDEERCIVSPIPGTTRDSVDVKVEHEGNPYTFIDTAGIRRKHAEHEVVDKFAFIRTERAIERSDICLLMIDAQQGLTAQEKKIANMIEAAGKGCIILFNKWDLVKGFRMEHCLQSIDEDVAFLRHCPKIFISVKAGRNIDKIFPAIREVYEDSKKRITTHQLNKFIGSAMQKNHPPMLQGKRLRIYYMAQVAIQPPKFIVFVNYANLMVESYKKYLYNQFRETYGFSGVPITLHLKGKSPRKAEADRAKHHAEEGDEHEEVVDEDFGDEVEGYEDNFEDLED